MAQEYVAVLVMLLSYLGIHVETGALMTTITTLTTIGSGLWLFYLRHKKGDITPLGFVKK